MNAKLELEKLKKEFISLNTEEEKKAFDVKFYSHIASKSEAEKTEFANAFVDGAKSEAKRAKELCQYIDVRLKMSEISDVVSMSYIAKNYFKKSKGWLSQKLNGNIINGTPAEFNRDEIYILSHALEDISTKINNTARSLV
ncbi:MAG: DUF5053 domain-containing protein [Candidatus Symbiothrix sp.]|jgi:predicted transcriptional regulator|nr:DUF5053 domain-containing protein [Candidatus Symbiothrix sp.]